jgi:hypothetical protein
MIKDIAALLPTAAVAMAIAVATKLFFMHQQKLKKVLQLDIKLCAVPKLSACSQYLLLTVDLSCTRTHAYARSVAVLRWLFEQFAGTKCLAELPSPPALPILGHNLAVVRHGFTQVSSKVSSFLAQQYRRDEDLSSP